MNAQQKINREMAQMKQDLRDKKITAKEAMEMLEEIEKYKVENGVVNKAWRS